ncbi:hypothetical protein WCT65_03625 [Pectobacterium carotovorum]|uniref:hypothetical protein n=1 Tax=Pectobacterium carotovorum TaxID=554 RepID=UPI003016BBB0
MGIEINRLKSLLKSLEETNKEIQIEHILPEILLSLFTEEGYQSVERSSYRKSPDEDAEYRWDLVISKSRGVEFNEDSIGVEIRMNRVRENDLDIIHRTLDRAKQTGLKRVFFFVSMDFLRKHCVSPLNSTPRNLNYTTCSLFDDGRIL